MTSTRLEAFSDGVIAIIITIMVLELRPPHITELAALRPLLPVFVSYAMSFVFIGGRQPKSPSRVTRFCESMSFARFRGLQTN
jgi:hypothetical protein